MDRKSIEWAIVGLIELLKYPDEPRIIFGKEFLHVVKIKTDEIQMVIKNYENILREMDKYKITEGMFIVSDFPNLLR